MDHATWKNQKRSAVAKKIKSKTRDSKKSKTKLVLILSYLSRISSTTGITPLSLSYVLCRRSAVLSLISVVQEAGGPPYLVSVAPEVSGADTRRRSAGWAGWSICCAGGLVTWTRTGGQQVGLVKLLWARAGGRRRLQLVSHRHGLLQGSGGASSTWRHDLLQGTGTAMTTAPTRGPAVAEERWCGLAGSDWAKSIFYVNLWQLISKLLYFFNLTNHIFSMIDTKNRLSSSTKFFLVVLTSNYACHWR
jgi:hypothetical protein